MCGLVEGEVYLRFVEELVEKDTGATEDI